MAVAAAANGDPPKKINMQPTDDYNFVPKSRVDIENYFFHILINAWVQRRAKKILRKRNIRNASKTLTNAQAEFQCEGQQGKWSYVQHGEEENNNNKNSYNNKKNEDTDLRLAAAASVMRRFPTLFFFFDFVLFSSCFPTLFVFQIYGKYIYLVPFLACLLFLLFSNSPASPWFWIITL